MRKMFATAKFICTSGVVIGAEIETANAACGLRDAASNDSHPPWVRPQKPDPPRMNPAVLGQHTLSGNSVIGQQRVVTAFELSSGSAAAAPVKDEDRDFQRREHLDQVSIQRIVPRWR